MRRPAALVVALVLALGAPVAPAFAQSAGDDQYQDPFGSSPGGNGHGSGSGTPSHTTHAPATTQPSASAGAGSSGTSSSGSTSSSSTPSSTATTTAAASSSSSRVSSQKLSASGAHLPRTGGEPGIVALFGAGLVLTGAGLRVRVRPRA